MSADFTQQAVDNLVTQFSSALDFYRELVQNSIDAGSSQVEIWLDFLPDEGGGTNGVIEIHVDDFGDGMNEEIIDSQLTTLFSSTKENDLTKIGKFGIGFVSVFAIGPRGVLVQTGRDGEYWEVFFDKDRSFFKSPLDHTVEGTQITLFLEGDRARYSQLVNESRVTIDHWCRHSEAEISFEDRASIDAELEIINKPFSVAGACHTHFTSEGTELVLAYNHAPLWGFYNRGLALAVVRGTNDLVPDRFAHIAFRMKSRYLEHTLSRETVMRDANYEKALARAEQAASGPLREALITALEGLVTVVVGTPKQGRTPAVPGRRWTMAERGRYFELMGYLAREDPEALDDLLGRPILVTLDGKAMTLGQVREATANDDRLFIDDQLTRLSERLIAQGTPVILAASTHELGGFGASAQGEDELGDGDDGPDLGGLDGQDPVVRVLANCLAGSFVTTNRLQRAINQVTGRLESSAWIEAVELIARPAEVLVAVHPIEPLAKGGLGEDDDAAHALVDLAQDIVLRSIGSGSGAVRRLFAKVRGRAPKIGYRRLVAAHMTGRAGEPEPLFVVAHEVAPLMAKPTPERLVSAHEGQPEAAINVDHPHFRALMRMAGQAPLMAGYCLAKSLLLAANRNLDLDAELMRAAMSTTR
ncbi:HSP90 [Plesiocystis pacifica SIR-1]|uniref:HSP90 n=1 Tax=Plesiocystis pacifica SIR-1 TaxID=391625 RepID=A6FXP0_9BACT|nr:ATP-binding protein [Plesiocystis pacifica]EDM81628.1 HSP90 [Plesiocystis pacifica SIR-1]